MDDTKEAASRGASEVAGTAKEQASSVVETAKQQGGEVARDAKQHAEQLVSQTRDQLRSHAQDQMRGLADTIQAIATQLDGLANGQPQPGMVLDVTNQLASTTRRMGEHLEQGGMESVMGDVKQFARQRPGTFLAASLLGGVVAGRVLRGTDVRELANSAKDALQSDGSAETPARDEPVVAPGLGTVGAPAVMPVVGD